MPVPVDQCDLSLWRPEGIAENAGAVFYFIDSNKAYRGPVNMDTLKHLFHSDLIGSHTYVYAETLCVGHSWMRIRKLPELLSELSKPWPQASGASAASAATVEISPGAAEALAKVAPKATNAPVIANTGRMNVTMVLPSPSQTATGGDPTTQPPPQPPMAAAASTALAAFPGASAGGNQPLYAEWRKHPFPPPKPLPLLKRIFGGRGAASPNKFGVALSKLPLSVDGTPQILTRLRDALWIVHGSRAFCGASTGDP